MAPKADWEKYKGPDKDKTKDDEPIVALDEVSSAIPPYTRMRAS